MFSDVVAKSEREQRRKYEKDRRVGEIGERKTMGRYRERYGTEKLEIFIAASFPFYAESRDHGWFHSSHLNTIGHRDVITG